MTSSSPVVANRSSLLLAAFAAGTFSVPAVASATDPLAVGIVSEGTILTTILRLAALISGALLAIFGARMPRFTLMSLFFVLAVPIGLATAGSINYFLSLLVILAALAVAAATVTLPGREPIEFPLDGFSKHCLLEGIDQLGYLLSQQADVDAFEQNRAWKP